MACCLPVQVGHLVGWVVSRRQSMQGRRMGIELVLKLVRLFFICVGTRDGTCV